MHYFKAVHRANIYTAPYCYERYLKAEAVAVAYSLSYCRNDDIHAFSLNATLINGVVSLAVGAVSSTALGAVSAQTFKKDSLV